MADTVYSSNEAAELPFSLEAEQTVLGAILQDPNVLPVVLETVRPECFFNPQHQELFQIILQMFTSGERADVVTVLNVAVQRKVFETAAEGRNYLAALINSVPSTSNIESYCAIVTEKYYIRCLAYAARGILQDIQSGEGSAQMLMDAAEQRIYDIRQGKDVQGLTKIGDAICEAYDHVGKIAGPDKEKYVGARTGFSYLDTVTSGLNKSDLLLIAARPGMGKTSFALNIATNVARHSGKEVAIFSLEMSKEQLVNRLLAMESHVDSQNMRTGNLKDEDWTKLVEGADIIGRSNLIIDDTPGISIAEMRSKCRKYKLEHNLGIIMIDYLQLMSGSGKSDSRQQEISDISRSLKALARELDVPVIALSQLSRAVEQRPDHRPMLSDLRESGAIEQDADVVMFLYRDDYYHKDTEKKDIAEVIIAKQRNGPIGTIELVWLPRYTQFVNMKK